MATQASRDKARAKPVHLEEETDAYLRIRISILAVRRRHGETTVGACSCSGGFGRRLESLREGSIRAGCGCSRGI